MVIGIIGIVLIVALSLAGASYLGPRFSEAGANKSALTALSAIRQTSDAISIYRLKSRNSTPNTTMFLQRLLDTGVLKTAPTNPFITAAPTGATVAAAWPYPVIWNGNGGVFNGAATRHSHLVMSLGTSNGARAACAEIQRKAEATTLNSANTIVTATTFASRMSVQPKGGCFRMSSGIAGIPANTYVIYQQD